MVSIGERLRRSARNSRRAIGNFFRALLCLSMTVRDEHHERPQSDEALMTVGSPNSEEVSGEAQVLNTLVIKTNSSTRQKKLPKLTTLLRSHFRSMKTTDGAEPIIVSGDVYLDSEFPTLQGLMIVDAKSLSDYELITDLCFWKACSINPDTDKFAVRVADDAALEREGAILRKLSGHKNFQTLHGLTRLDDGNYGLVQSMARGDDMESLRRKGELDKFSFQDKVYIALQICAAVDSMHSNGIVHQNICSNSIVIDKDTLTVTIIDFRNAAFIDDPSRAGRGLGDLPYMAPEAVLDHGPTSFKEDVWSLGMALALLFTGVSPYQSQVSQVNEFMDLHAANKKRPRYIQKRSRSVEMNLYTGKGDKMLQVGTLINLSVCPTPGLRTPAKELVGAFAMILTMDTEVA